MADIVIELKRRNWSDEKIGRELGMEPDEVLRLAQITGLAEMFADREFSEAWEHAGEAADLAEGSERADLEWLNAGIVPSEHRGWHQRSAQSAILYGDGGQQLGLIQHSRFADEWFWYAYTAPPVTGRAQSEADAKTSVEAANQT